MKHVLLIVTVALVNGALALLSFGETTTDEEVPLTKSENRFRELLESSPFTRSLKMPSSLFLTGIAEIDGRQVATLFDPESEESFSVSEIPNEKGWRLIEVMRTYDLEDISAKVMVQGGEVVTVRFDERQLRPTENPRKTSRSSQTPRGGDRRPPPTDDDRRKFGEYIRGRMSKMTEEQKKRVGEIAAEKNLWRNPDLSDRQKGETYIKIMDHVEKGEGKR